MVLGLGFLLCVGCVVRYSFLFSLTLYYKFYVSIEQQKRVATLMAAAVFEGASIGPLIDLAIQIDPRYLFIFYDNSLVTLTCDVRFVQL